jgi:hypothetical protein
VLEALFRSWQRVLLHPSVQSFDAERPQADYNRVWLGLVAYAIVGGIAAFISQIVNGAFNALVFARSSGAAFQLGTILATAVGALVATAIGALIGLWIGSGIYWVSARAFGANGTYKDQTYLISLSAVPLGIIGSVASIIPFLGGLVALAAAIYQIVLTVFALQSAHQVSGGRAFLIWLLPTLVVLALVCACVLALVFVGAAIFGAAGRTS